MTGLRLDRSHATRDMTAFAKASSRPSAALWQAHVDSAAMVSCRLIRTFKDGPLRGSFRQMYHA
jgi:hypothetical protein